MRRLQPVDQVPRSARRPRASSAPRCWRPATTSPRAPLPGGGRALYRAREEERDQSYFLFAHHARAARPAALSARRHDQGRDPRARAPLRAAGRRQARQPGHLLRADRPLHRRDRAAASRAPPSPATSSISTAACSAAMTASSISPSASGAGSASPPASRSTWCGSTRRRAASWSGRARRCARSRMRLREVNWIGDGTLDEALRRRPARGVRQGALDAAAAAGVAEPRRRRHRGRTGRRRGRRVARPGLRVLRRGRRPGARARRRLHPERGRGRRAIARPRDVARGVRRRARHELASA